MVSYTVAAAVFILGSSVLFGFVVEPPGASTANLEQLDLRSQSTTALQVLLGTPGLPATWESSTEAIDDIDRLGLIEQGTSIRINPDKFDALARGKFAVTSSTNGFVDYGEAKDALGLDGYEFHLRAYPLLSPGNEIDFGTEGMDDFRVAYVTATDGDGDPTAGAALEIAALSQLDIGFDPAVRETSDGSGDVFADDSHDLRDLLLPNIGASMSQTVLSNGAGTKYDFARMPDETHAGLTTIDTLSGAMALAVDTDGDEAPDTLGYTKNRELRALVGAFEVPSATLTLTWDEWVDTDRGNGTYDCGDYGYAEYSFDDGATWTPVASDLDEHSRDCASTIPLLSPFGNAPATRSFEIPVVCSEPVEAGEAEPDCEMLLAYHWIADNDNNIGYGWVVDDIQVYEDGGILGDDTTYFRKNFETPEYDMLIVGSEADHSAFTPNQVKNGVRDFVDEYGGRLLVLGGQEDIGDIQWLDRLFDVGVGGGAGGLAVPDTTHPLLTLPNELSFEDYAEPTNLYTLDDDEAALFSMIIGESENAQALAVAREGAFGSGTSTDGSVMLSAYMPYEFDPDETARFFANAVVYGKFHYLYLEVGPPIPDGEAVASAARSATMNMYRTGDPEYTEMAFVMYVWPGQTADQTLASTLVEASAPREVEATASGANVHITWEEPVTWGTGTLLRYEILTGTTLDPTTLLASVDADDPLAYTHSGASLGVTHYYRVRAVTDLDAGADVDESPGIRSSVVGAMPVALPAAPATPGGAAAIGSVTLSWSSAWTTQTGNIYGYGIYESTDGTTYTLAAEVGNVTQAAYNPADTTPRTYKFAAYNARGYGPLSAATPSVAPLADLPGPLLNVGAITPDELTLTWVAPDAGAYTIVGYRVYRADAEDGTYTELASVGATLTHTDEALGPSVERWYKVRAITTVGDGSYSDAEGATTMAVPDAPLLDAATVGGVTTLTWTAPDSDAPVTSYEIYRGASASETTTQVASTALLTYSGAFDPTKPYYRVKAVSGAGASDWSNAEDATAPPVSAPALLVTALAPNNLTLTWTAPASLYGQTVTGYNVYRSTTAGGVYALIGTTGAGTLTYNDASLGASVTRYYRVSAVTVDGEGTQSSATGGTTMAVPGAPTLTATRVLSTATLVWTAPASDASIVRYDIYKGASSGNVATFVKSVSGATLTTTDTYGASTKWYTVVAVSAAGAGAPSNADDASS